MEERSGSKLMKITLAQRFRNKKFLILFCVIAVVVIAAIATTCILLVNQHQEQQRQEHIQEVNKVLENTDTFFDGITVQGVDISGMTMEEATEAVTAVQDTARPNIQLTMTYNGQDYVYDTDRFAFTYDTDQILEQAYAIGRTGTSEECYNAVQQLKENPVSYSITATLTDEGVQAVVNDVAAQINIPMVNARAVGVDFSKSGSDRFQFAEGTSGLAVDTNDLKAKVDAALAQADKVATLQVVANTVQPTLTVADMQPYVQEICTFSTRSTNSSAGNHNMALALSFCNGTIVNPGETFSFCQTTGNSTNGSLGYVPAGVILNGKSDTDYGGGICQASTTLYGAVLRADLTIVERHNHSWPSSYVPIGQDAAVSYPGTDFQFRNDTNVPVFIQAGMEGRTLTVTLYGYKSSDYDYIRITSQKTGTMATSLGTGCTASGEKEYIKDGQVIRTEAIPNSSYRKDGSGGSNVDAIDTEAPNTASTPETATSTPETPATTPSATTPTPEPTPSTTPSEPAAPSTPEPTPSETPSTPSEPTSQPEESQPTTSESESSSTTTP